MPAGTNDFSKVDLSALDEWLTMAEDFGFYVIIRPGPYICAEWDTGGFPPMASGEKARLAFARRSLAAHRRSALPELVQTLV